MTAVFIWIVIIGLFIFSYIGLLYPIIPSVILIWIGFLLYYFLLAGNDLTLIFWIAMGILTILLIISDIIANSYFVKRFGGSKLGEQGAAIAVIIGSFIIPPFGIFILPFIVVFMIEILQKRTVTQAFRASVGSLIGFLGSSLAKIAIQTIMIIWFLIAIFF